MNASTLTPTARFHLESHALDAQHVSMRVHRSGTLHLVALSTVRPDGRSAVLCLRFEPASEWQPPHVHHVVLPAPDVHTVKHLDAATLIRRVVALDHVTAALVEYGRLSFVHFDTATITRVQAAISAVRHIVRVGPQALVVYCVHKLFAVELQSDRTYNVHALPNPVAPDVSRLCASGHRFFAQGHVYCTLFNARTRHIESSTLTPNEGCVEAIALDGKHHALLCRTPLNAYCVQVSALRRSLHLEHLSAHRDGDWPNSCMQIVRNVLLIAFKSHSRFYFLAVHLVESAQRPTCCVPYASAVNSLQNFISPQFAVMPDGTLCAMVADHRPFLARYRLPAPFDALLSSAADTPKSTHLPASTEVAPAT
eukprot:TRINITY_DN822_c0_g1_i1.p1 TRINITY_DN822_c0_g1~~TRINITY_DN822_c0_g1_i1.p1  ORF type:complete len:367 (+),score=58.46 TRINITY_DN822_c0_g1_i1:615-1715(+)